jgi:hypothetical protein
MVLSLTAGPLRRVAARAERERDAAETLNGDFQGGALDNDRQPFIWQRIGRFGPVTNATRSVDEIGDPG